MGWKPFSPDKKRVQYHVDLDKKFEWPKHELLDEIPKKSIGDQINDLIVMGEQLAESRIRALDLPDVGDGDPDDADTGIDEWSDPEDYRRAMQDLERRFEAAQKKKKTPDDVPEPVKSPAEVPPVNSTPQS